MKRIIISAIALVGFSMCFAQNHSETEAKKTAQLFWMIDNFYVDTADVKSITEKGITEMLKHLDPHSTYISPKDVRKANEPLEGNIEGIGISFQIMSDTIHVIDVIADGPSERVGLIPGDKIIKVNDSVATGDSINEDWVRNHLRGKKGSKVRVSVARNGRGTIDFNIIRDRIPLNSIDTWFMIDDEVGYISLRRFAQTSDDEFRKAVEDLKSQGMRKLIFDLRSNGGGYLDAAQKIVDEFLTKRKLIVYTQGIKSPRQELYSSRKGVWEKGELVILTDEYTASASEITSGAVQDWDRGVIVGRRTFGKGLVQRPFNMIDASQIRLTTSRYYIPSGRCIQKPYDDGAEEYYKDYQKRYQHKEMIYADSISFPDSLKFKTDKGRTVYGGGGIMPDVFVPMDTVRASDYFINLRSKNLFNEFSLTWAEENREDFLKKYPDYKSFDSVWESLRLTEKFVDYAETKGVRSDVVKTDWVNKIVTDYLKNIQQDSLKNNSFTSYEEYARTLLSEGGMIDSVITQAQNEDIKQRQYIKTSQPFIEANLKGYIARNLYGVRYYYMAMQKTDATLQQAINIIKDKKRYKEILSK